MLALATSGCVDVDFDGLYRVESYTLHEGTCTGPGEDLVPEYPKFRIEGRRFAGVAIYPVYPCDENGLCQEDNDADWNLVTTPGDQDQVSSTYAGSLGDSCVLGSMDMVIEGVEETVVLQRRVSELVIEPYDPQTCTTDNAKRKRNQMECVSLVELVGVPDGADAM